MTVNLRFYWYLMGVFSCLADCFSDKYFFSKSNIFLPWLFSPVEIDVVGVGPPEEEVPSTAVGGDAPPVRVHAVKKYILLTLNDGRVMPFRKKMTKKIWSCYCGKK